MATLSIIVINTPNGIHNRTIITIQDTKSSEYFSLTKFWNIPIDPVLSTRARSALPRELSNDEGITSPALLFL